jgi:outer membrane protein assembly factor BamB
MKIRATILLASIFIVSHAQNYDWPMWRNNFERSASTPEKLADKLYLQWQSQFTPRNPVWDDPLNQNLMQYDRILEPIVVDNKIFIGFNDQDKVIALDINTGKELWHYYADGPVRLPLASNNMKIYFTSDDGYCYCLNGKSGSLVWKVLLAPGPNKLLGNKRLISMWPARGGIVIKDNILYTAASIWPMMGTFIYAINANTGDIIWKNEGTSDNYILQPHNYFAFADVAPQGSFAISGNKLLVAGGRTVPAAFDLKTGKELYYRLAEGNQKGGSFICCNENIYFNHLRGRMTVMYDSKNGDLIKTKFGEYPVIDGNNIYFSGKKITATVLNDNKNLDVQWDIDIPARNDLIKAGACLFAADSNTITAINITDNKPQKLWTIKTDKNIERLVAARGKLVAISDDGAVMVFGDMPVKAVKLIYKSESKLVVSSSLANEIIGETKNNTGYALVFGAKDIELLKGLVSKTQLSVIAFEKDSKKMERLREYFDNTGIKADRLCFLPYNNSPLPIPKYISSLTVVDDISYLNGIDKDVINTIYESLRPYGGKLWINANGEEQQRITKTVTSLDLYGSEFKNGNNHTLITRSGALKGSADWTHNYGNISNTVKSDDDIVKAPLGILWFGGNSNLDVLPRHGHGPSEQVIDGRLIIQGMNTITARDVYTGRVLWQKVFENLDKDTWLIYYDETYDGTKPLETKYNQVHIPGANARGTNFIATKEYVYAIEGPRCHLIDINTGQLVKTFTTGDENTTKLGYIGVYKNYLILGNNFTKYPVIEPEKDAKIDKKFENFDVTASKELLILDRFNGKKLWSMAANHGFIHNGIIVGDDILFCLDKLPMALESRLKRRGESPPEGSRLLYLDINTGKTIHQETKNIFGTWLGYSSAHKLLLQATRPSSDMLNEEKGQRMIVYKTETRDVLWDKPVSYTNPPIINGEEIYTNNGGFSLLTGEPLVEKDFITGENVKWNFKREYGCGYVVASEHLLTFRSTAAGFINLDTREGVGNFGGFKAGCSANLIVANGVLNAPDYTRTCQCSYQNQTSLALISMPWMNYWTTTTYVWSGKPVKQLGINLNAPGDRTSANNTLWLDFPSVGGISPDIPVKMDTVDYFKIRKNPISIKSENTPWVSASAVGGIRSIEITLSKGDNEPEGSYRINLYFSELENKKAGERVFDVGIQNKNVLQNFDIVKETGQQDKELIKSFTGIKAGKTLRIDMKPVKGNTILSGIELIRES